MGQKIHPGGLRVGVIHDWKSNWYTGTKDFPAYLLEDIKIREELMKQLKQAAVSHIVIERPHKKCRVTIHSARPGVVIGKKGADIEKLKILERPAAEFGEEHARARVRAAALVAAQIAIRDAGVKKGRRSAMTGAACHRGAPPGTEGVGLRV